MKSSNLLLGAAAFGAIAAGTTLANADGFQHIVVIYEENHSFDNLYGNWGSVGGTPVNGLSNATDAQKTQIRQDNVTPYNCLCRKT